MTKPAFSNESNIFSLLGPNLESDKLTLEILIKTEILEKESV